MAEAFVLWSGAGYAKLLAEIIAAQGGRVFALFDNAEIPAALAGVPVYYGEAGFRGSAEQHGDLSSTAGLVATGGSRGRGRLAILTLFCEYGIALPIPAHPAAFIYRRKCRDWRWRCCYPRYPA